MSGINNIAIEGFRVFNSKQEFDFAGINIITGKNNSGKSSLFRIFKLLKTSAINKDFSKLFFDETEGQDSFQNQITNDRDNSSKFIKVTLPFDFSRILKNCYIELWYSCEINSLKKNGILSCIHLFTKDNGFQNTILKISNLWESDEEERQTKATCAENADFPNHQYTIIINYLALNNILKSTHKEPSPIKPFDIFNSISASDSDMHDENEYLDLLEKPFFSNNLKIDLALNKEYIYPTDGYMKFVNDESYGLVNVEERLVESLNDYCSPFCILKENYETPFEFLDLFLFNSLDRFKHEVDTLESKILVEKNINIIEALKWELNTTRYRQYLLFDLFKIAFDSGLKKLNNLAGMQFISPIRNHHSRYIVRETKSPEIETLVEDLLKNQILDKKIPKNFINFWLNEFELGEEIRVDTSNGGLTKSILLRQNDTYINLADLGFGVGQLVPIILKIALVGFQNQNLNYPIHIKNSIMCLEEPETSLHPALQSKLADFIIDASFKFGIQFIIETHSEYLVRKIQYWSAKQKLTSSSTIIYYLTLKTKSSALKQQVTKITIDDSGSLSEDFGKGFFDEADSIAIDIWNLPSKLN